MSAKLLFYIGMFLLVVGMLYPLGVTEFTLIKYVLYAGIISFALGIVFLPGRNES